MANFDFDLENAENELECVKDLLNIFREFFDMECPEVDEYDKKSSMSAVLFAKRARHFNSLIEAAQDKVNTIHEAMRTAIDLHFENKQNGGDAA